MLDTNMASYVLPQHTDIKTWLEIGKALDDLLQSQETRMSMVYWWVGDWLVFGEKHFGEEHTQALDDFAATYS
ncbi:MAG: hypothetical protein HOI95_13235, partial [Chromatiales bacterium]|nr:hypothetical protein [Chromatiales bacterium]